MKSIGPACLGKIGYTTRAEADRAKRYLRAKPNFDHASTMNTYCCTRCGRFHLGRSRRDGIKELRRIPDHETGSYQSRKARYAELVKS